MSSSKKTTYYNLSQFQDADKPTWRGDYNGDMSKIDTGIRDASVKATDARTAADNAAATANTAKTTANTAKTTADNAATVAATAKTTADNAKTAADNATNTANTASTTANTASTTASSANTTANAANTTANSANTTANAAKTAADTALSAARGNIIGNQQAAGVGYIGHRCGSGYPEQSVAGAEWCWQHGFMPEIDVQLTSDGYPVLIHDDTTGRTMQGDPVAVDTLTLKQFTSRTLKSYMTGGYEEPAPSLYKMLAAAAGRPTVIECKTLTAATMTAIINMVKSFRAEKTHTIICFDKNLTKQAAAAGLTAYWLHGMPTSSEINELKTAGVAGVSLDYGSVNATNVQTLHNNGLKVSCWTINDRYGAVQCENAGVDYITSDFPDYVSNSNFSGEPAVQNGVARGYYNNSSSAAGTPGAKTEAGITASVFNVNGSTLLAYYDKNLPHMPFFTGSSFNQLRLQETSKNYVPYIHIKGVSGSSDSDVQQIFRVALYQNSEAIDKCVGYADTALAGQTAVQVMLRRNGTLAVWTKTDGGAPTKGEEATNVGQVVANGDRVPFNIRITFGNESVTVRGHVGTKTINKRLAYNRVLPDGANYRAAIGFTPDYSDQIQYDYFTAGNTGNPAPHGL